MIKPVKAILILISAGFLLVGCTNPPEEPEVVQLIEADPTVVSTSTPNEIVEPTTIEEPTIASTSTPDAIIELTETEESTTMIETTEFLLPERAGPRTQTSGRVPHVQFDVEPNPAVNEELFRRAYLLPGVEDRPTIISMPGGRGMWLSDDVPVANPLVILSGREFAHIHTDGSLHAPLPVDRAMEVAEKGWGEMHPWSGERQGFDGFVMLYTPITLEELEITFQLIVESYNHVTGQAVQASEFE